MKIYIISQNYRENIQGLTLPEIGYEYKYVNIYRAMAKSVNTINYMDFITRNFKFAKEHADHMAAVTEDPYIVLKVMAEAKDIAQAPNTDEFFYINKNPINGKIVYEIDYENL